MGTKNNLYFIMVSSRCYNPPAKYVIGQLVDPLANGSLFVHGSTHSQITLNTDPPTKSACDLSVNAQVLPHKAGQ